jgi:RHH-type proline utilization regulon transcriptional repressor/proline dehydrogenase/delta 1-pyrroline-5-carboxylate dehydrogenase
MRPFANEPLLELRRAAVRDELSAALAELDAAPPLDVPVLVGGEPATDRPLLVSVDPGEPGREVARARHASRADVAAAVAAAGDPTARAWAALPAGERTAVLDRAAGLLRERRRRLAALQVREAAKPWPEADADVCEAIDFLAYYGREATRLAAGPPLNEPPGERNELRYVACGVAAVIAPWNFPLAIATGMTAAALAAGNAVVLKPAEQTPGCAFELVRALHEAGVPPAALALLPGEGEVGAALVRDPGVHVIAFTGSGEAGLDIMRAAADPAHGQRHLKRVVAEMGGKNCVIVDSDADLDETVPALLHSAFGFAGQKCSAAARVLAHEAVLGPLLERLRGGVERLLVDRAERFGVDVPPVIDAEARERVELYAAGAAEAGRVAAFAEPPGGEGFFCAPTVVCELPPDAPVLREEVFGPLLCVEGVASIEAACDRVDELPFALTGGLFSRDPQTIRRVTQRTPVGNLYVNRHITGAMVGRQPFGGNRLSGTGAKAGGPDYLMHFLEPRVVTENTLRHGLVV